MCSVMWTWISCLRFTFSPEEIEQRHKSQQIDSLLKKERQVNLRQVKLLLLGAGESGKSTFLKQMRIIHGVKFEPELVKEYQKVIYENIVMGMRKLLEYRDKYNIPWENKSNSASGSQILTIEKSMKWDTRLFINYAPSLRSLWKDSGIRKTFERRREYHLADYVQYFLDNLDRIARTDYIPTDQDILHARKATQGITEFIISINNIPFRFIDVGGQRSQRHKWVHCFDRVTSILFLVSTSEFDQVLSEDGKTNRLEESCIIFDTIVNNYAFRDVSFILFLNKTDLLAQKLQARDTNITHYFPQFKGDPYNLTDVQLFILNLFKSVKRDQKKSLFHHFTTAIDTENIKVVFNAVKESILHRNLQSLMLE